MDPNRSGWRREIKRNFDCEDKETDKGEERGRKEWKREERESGGEIEREQAYFDQQNAKFRAKVRAVELKRFGRGNFG